MQCLYCGSPDTRVTDSAKVGNKVLRERACKSCHKQFYTEESTVTDQIRTKSQLRFRRNGKEWQ